MTWLIEADSRGRSISKLLSIVIALSYTMIAYWQRGQRDAALVIAMCVFPLLLIWFPTALGDHVGFGPSRMATTKTSPGVMVSFMGWILLLLPLIIYGLLHLSGHDPVELF